MVLQRLTRRWTASPSTRRRAGRAVAEQQDVWFFANQNGELTEIRWSGWCFGTWFYFSKYWNFNPNWRTHIFQRGRYTTKCHQPVIFHGIYLLKNNINPLDMICGCVWNVISSQMAFFMRQWFSRSSELSNMAGKSSVEVLMEQNIYNWGMFNCHYLQILSHRIDVWYISVYANIWVIVMVNVTIYSIHGSYGYQILSKYSYHSWESA